jgi:hypothetical protein
VLIFDEQNEITGHRINKSITQREKDGQYRVASYEQEQKYQTNEYQGSQDLSNLKSFITKKFEKLDQQMLVLCEMQKQNQEIVRRCLQ